MKRASRCPQRDPRCDAVTPALCAWESVPAGARWRVSWAIAAGERMKRVAAYLFHDDGARKWCATQGIPFAGDQAAMPALQPVAPPATSLDVRSRAAGDA